MAENEAALKQAANASKAAAAVLDQQSMGKGSDKKSGGDASLTKLQTEVNTLKEGETSWSSNQS